MNHRLFSFAFAFATALGAAGCSVSTHDDSPPPPPPDTEPPHVTDVRIAAWPPPGPGSLVTVRATDDRNLDDVTASFKGLVSRPVSGTSAEVSFRAEDLGEGFGDLVIRACDRRFACADRTVTRFLVDLTPPEIDEDRVVASPKLDGVEGEISFWVGDAWVLGSVEMTYAGKRFSKEFSHAYPDTIGKSWDVSRVAFPASEMPEGTGDAVIVVKDAAGNSRTSKVTLRIDGTPPLARIAEPADGTTVSGSFVVRAQGSDPGSTKPVALDVFVGGALVGSFTGPETVILVDVDTLPKGPVSVRAVATDEAGNRSVVARSTVTVQ